MNQKEIKIQLNKIIHDIQSNMFSHNIKENNLKVWLPNSYYHYNTY